MDSSNDIECFSGLPSSSGTDKYSSPESKTAIYVRHEHQADHTEENEKSISWGTKEDSPINFSWWFVKTRYFKNNRKNTKRVINVNKIYLQLILSILFNNNTYMCMYVFRANNELTMSCTY